jgi:hypothetical protein
MTIDVPGKLRDEDRAICLVDLYLGGEYGGGAG